MNNFSHKGSFTMSQCIETNPIWWWATYYTATVWNLSFNVLLLFLSFFFSPLPIFYLFYTKHSFLHVECKHKRTSAFVYKVNFQFYLLCSAMHTSQNLTENATQRDKKQSCFYLLLRLSKALLSAKIGSFAL